MKTAIITGATRGIGLALARIYARHGFCLTINGGHDEKALLSVEKELSSQTRVISCFGSVSDENTSKDIIQGTMDAFGQIDLLINNAGISHIGLLSDMTSSQWHDLMGTNLDSVFYMSRAAIPHMVHRHTGKILNISSFWGEVGASCETAYSASKGAVNAFTRALAKELAPSGISVNAISFGVVDTDMNRGLSAEERASLCTEIPYGRFASQKEAADFCYQITESPSYLTGQVIRFDGGFI